MANHGVVHFEIPASDPARLADFYRQLFGWEIQKFEGEMPYWFVMTTDVDEETQMPKEPGAINGGLYPRQNPQQVPINYVDVEDVNQYVEKAKTIGAQVVVERSSVPQMGWFAILTDPDGNSFGVWQNDSTAG